MVGDLLYTMLIKSLSLYIHCTWMCVEFSVSSLGLYLLMKVWFRIERMKKYLYSLQSGDDTGTTTMYTWT